METTSSLQSLQTQEVLEHARNGNESAWKVLYLRYRVFLLLSARRALDRGGKNRPIEEEEDILQSAFLRAWKRISTFDYQGEKSFRGWLATVVMNTAADKSRKHRDRPHVTSGALETMPVKSDASGEVIRALETLTPMMRDVVVLKRYEKKTWRELAELLGVSESTARRTYVQALDALREEIDSLDAP